MGSSTCALCRFAKLEQLARQDDRLLEVHCRGAFAIGLQAQPSDPLSLGIVRLLLVSVAHRLNAIACSACLSVLAVLEAVVHAERGLRIHGRASGRKGLTDSKNVRAADFFDYQSLPYLALFSALDSALA